MAGMSAGAIISLVASLATAAAGAAKVGYDLSQPKPKSLLPTPATPDYSGMSRARLPGATANAAALTGGGMSPQFMTGMLDQQTGEPGGSLGIIDEIRKGLGQAGGGQAP